MSPWLEALLAWGLIAVLGAVGWFIAFAVLWLDGCTWKQWIRGWRW